MAWGSGADAADRQRRLRAASPSPHHAAARAEGLAGPRARGGGARRFGLQLVANQPKARLHSQLDIGAHSQSAKIAGRERVRMNPGDAEARGLRDGDLVRIFNDRGACLAGLAVDEAVRPGVAQLSTGAWYDPDPADPGFCRHGNPNVLTADLPSSTLSQGCTGQLALVEVEAYRRTPPELSVTRPPATA